MQKSQLTCRIFKLLLQSVWVELWIVPRAIIWSGLPTVTEDYIPTTVDRITQTWLYLSIQFPLSLNLDKIVAGWWLGHNTKAANIFCRFMKPLASSAASLTVVEIIIAVFARTIHDLSNLCFCGRLILLAKDARESWNDCDYEKDDADNDNGNDQKICFIFVCIISIIWQLIRTFSSLGTINWITI